MATIFSGILWNYRRRDGQSERLTFSGLFVTMDGENTDGNRGTFMKKFCNNFLASMAFLTLVCLLFTACRSESVPPSAETAATTAAAEKTLDGTVTDASMNVLTVTADEGGVYSFADYETVLDDGLNLLVGARIRICYAGTLNRQASVQAVTLNRILLAPAANLTTTASVIPVPVTTTLPLTTTTTSSAPVKTPEHLLAGMTLKEKIGQMFIVRCPESGGAQDVEQYQMGGYILFDRDFNGFSRQEVIDHIQSYQQKAKLPLLIGVDEEGGIVNRVSHYFRAVPFWSPQDLYKEGGLPLIASDTEEKADLLHSLGINLNFAPVCDVSTDPDDYIHARSFGQNGRETAKYVETVVSTMQEKRMGSVLKHFPGYGNNKDTHTGIAHDSRPYSMFEKQDFLPFKAGIKAGAGCVLVSHNIVASMDKQAPASLSANVHRILREELGFDGVIMTDDLYMQAIRQYTGDREAAVVAVKAGNDMLCCTNYREQIPAVIAAVQNGDITEERIDESVLRILRWKQTLGLFA